MNKKLIIGVLLLITGYFGFDYIVVVRLGYLTLKCASPIDREKISDKSNLSNNEKLKITSKIFTCVRGKQSSIERLIIKVPENWVNPPTVP